MMTDCFALLDDCAATDAEPRSRLYTGLAGTLECGCADELPALLANLQQALAAGKQAVGLLAYELGAQLQGVGHKEIDRPLAQVLLFERCERMSNTQVTQWLQMRVAPDALPSGIGGVRANVSETEFTAAIDRIRAYIEAGDVYQINYTYRLMFDLFGSPLALYQRLRQRQPVPYGALIALPGGRAVLSLSPELFIRHQGGELTAQPMKGTAPASGDDAADAAAAQALAADEKNRAENLMIVDLLRNDLGRVAQTGSVRTPALFDVGRFGHVLQMTSTVRARLRTDATLADIFRAIYPCGSITGAPKRRAMQIIDQLEPAPRGLYTGAIGWFDPPADQNRSGDFCLSVPIRTLTLGAPDEASGVRRGELGIGAGIVHDSEPADEYEECQLKASFLTGLPQTFALFETMLATQDGCRQLDLHLQRLRASASYFSFAFDEAALRAAVRQACDVLPDVPEGEHRLRLALAATGIELQTAPLTPLTTPVRLLLSAGQMQSGNLFLRHKTTVRRGYDAAWREAERQGAFDMLFFNERGELTEGGRSNVFIKLDGRWFTPPLSAGLLPGVMRSLLLADPAWNAAERTLTLADLRRAEAVVACNALRGALPAQVVWDRPVAC
ncbi:MAG: pabB [Burkholderiaceae bacterium]|nr:pabB [Burkholderiaceae bacterium]